MTPQEQLELQVLEHIHREDKGRLREPANLGPLREAFGEDRALDVAKSLRDRGLIESEQRLSGGYHITGAGRSVIEDLHQRQGDRSRRRVACREQLLTWLDANSDHARGQRPGAEEFDGQLDLLPFTLEETGAAADHLRNRGFIKTIDSLQGLSAMWITEAGREAVDAGGVEAAEHENQVAPSVVQNFNMTGHANSVANATADGASATAIVDASTFNLGMAKTYASMVRSMGDDADLDDDDRAALVAIEEASEGGDLSRSQRAMAHLYSASGKIATGAAGTMLGAIGKQALGING